MISRDIVILGSTGWIGSYLLQNLENAIPANGLPSRFNSKVLLDWLNQSRPNRIVNCIGQISGEFHQLKEVNSDLVNTVLNYCESTGAHLVNMGSAAEYGRTVSPRLKEDARLEPVSEYGRTKQLACQRIIEFVETGGNATHIRLFNVFGEGQTVATALGQILKRMLHSSKKNPVVIDDYDIVRDYISLESVKHSIDKIFSIGKVGVINLGSGYGTSLSEIVSEISSRGYGYSVFGKLHKDRIKRVIADTSKLLEIGLEIPQIRSSEIVSEITKNLQR